MAGRDDDDKHKRSYSYSLTFMINHLPEFKTLELQDQLVQNHLNLDVNYPWKLFSEPCISIQKVGLVLIHVNGQSRFCI